MVDQRFFPTPKEFVLQDLLEAMPESTKPIGDIHLPQTIVKSVAEPQSAGPGEISFVGSAKYAKGLENCSASVIFVSADVEVSDELQEKCVTFANPHRAFVDATNILTPHTSHRLAEIPFPDDLPPAKLEDQVSLQSGVIIGNGAEIGSGTNIGPNSVIGPNVKIGRDCKIEANVTIECAYIGDRVTIRSGARVGNVGFGLLDHGKSNVAVPQVGRIILQNDTEIGVNCVIDRGALGDTEIAENSKIGNLVQIGHNCKIGRNVLIAPMSGLSGATTIGDGTILAAAAQSSGHLKIGNNCFVHAGASVTKDWPDNSKIIGAPAQPVMEYWKQMATMRKIARRGEK